MLKRTMGLAVLAVAMGLWAGGAVGMEEKPAATQPKNAGFEALHGLAGIWEVTSPKEKSGNPGLIVIKPTAGGTAMMETMYPRTEMEMVNMFTLDGQGVMLTHYCHMGNQPRMRAAGIEKGVLKFEFVDGGNLKSRDDAHMDSVEMTIDGDKLTEKWSMYKDGKVTETMVFEMTRKK